MDLYLVVGLPGRASFWTLAQAQDFAVTSIQKQDGSLLQNSLQECIFENLEQLKSLAPCFRVGSSSQEQPVVVYHVTTGHDLVQQSALRCVH